MSLRGNQVTTVKYNVRIYKTLPPPQLNFRLKSRPNPYVLHITSLDHTEHRNNSTLTDISKHLAQFIVDRTRDSKRNSQLHYIWGTLESIPSGVPGVTRAIPITHQEWEYLNGRLHTELASRRIKYGAVPAPRKLSHTQRYSA